MVCAGKANGEDCKSPANCASDYCSAGACGVKPTAVKANDGDACVASADCKSDMCSAAVCVAKPENKKDIGLPCKVSSDCKSDLCAGDVCKAKTADKKDDGLPCVAAADCKSDTCSQNVCVAKSTGSGMLAGVLSIPTTATITGDDGVGKAAELISSTVQMVNGAAEAAVEIVPCRSTVYFNVDMSGTLAKADYDAVMTAVTTAAESMMKEENTYVGVVTFRGPVTQTEFKSAADTDSDCTGAPTTDAAGTPATLGGSSSAKVPATTPATAPARRRLFASHDATTPAGTPTADDIAAGTDAANPLSMPFVKATSDLTEFKAQVGYGSYEKNIDGAGDAAQRNPSQSDVGAGLKMSASATEWYEEHDESPRKKYIITLLAQTPINLEKMKKQSTAAKTAGNFLMFYNMNMQTVTTPTLSNDLASKDAAGVRTHFVDDSEAPAKVNLDKLVKQFKANFKATRETVAGKKKYCTMAKTPDDA